MEIGHFDSASFAVSANCAVFYAQRAHAKHVLEGLRKARLEIPGNPPVVETAVTSAGGSGPMPADQGP